MSRREGRELALKVLFQVDVGKMDADEALANTLEDVNSDEATRTFTKQLVKGTVASLSDVDAVIREFAIDWHLERMANIDRNILRLAVYELLQLEDVPASVSVNEAVELAKEYGDANSPKFVNGILGNIVRQKVPHKV